jgi:hypothetical protein
VAPIAISQPRPRSATPVSASHSASPTPRLTPREEADTWVFELPKT